MQGYPQDPNPHKMSGKTKGFLWAGGIGGFLALIMLAVVALAPVLFYLVFFVVGSGVNAVVGEENMPYHSKNREGVTRSVEKFTPKQTWTQISKTEVHKPAACTDAERGKPGEDCEMFKGVWNTNAPLPENGIIEIAESFGGISQYSNRPELIKDACVRAIPEAPLDPCTTMTYVEDFQYNTYGFELTLTDEGPGTNVTATVRYVR